MAVDAIREALTVTLRRADGSGTKRTKLTKIIKSMRRQRHEDYKAHDDQ
jgi:hypothetical protein